MEAYLTGKAAELIADKKVMEVYLTGKAVKVYMTGK